jgi:hypothetical protein
MGMPAWSQVDLEKETEAMNLIRQREIPPELKQELRMAPSAFPVIDPRATEGTPKAALFLVNVREPFGSGHRREVEKSAFSPKR